MNFDLSPEQTEFQSSVGKFLGAECTLGRILQSFEDPSIGLDAWQGLMDLGAGSIMIPEEYGGAGLGLLDLAAVAEIVGRHGMPGPFLDHAIASLAIVLGGSPDQRQRWLPRLASGELRGTIAMAEGADVWLPGDWKAEHAERISFTKDYVPHAQGADLFVVGLAGGRLGLVDGRSSGIEIVPLNGLDGTRALYRATFDCAPCEFLEARADLAERVLDAALVLLAADAYGGASRCLEMTVEYAKERVQFDVPIARFQVVRHQLADIALEVEPLMGLYWYAAHQFDLGSAEAPLHAALAKAQATEAFANVTRRSVELHGGIGFTWEHGAHIWLKRAVFDRTFLGQPRRHWLRAADLAGW